MNKKLIKVMLSSLLLCGLPVAMTSCNADNKNGDDKPTIEEAEKASVILENANHGTLVASTKEGKVGDKVLITATAAENYKVRYVKHNGKILTANSEGKYEFTLVKGENKITASFVESDAPELSLPDEITSVVKPDYVKVVCNDENFENKEYKKGDKLSLSITSSDEEYTIQKVSVSNGQISLLDDGTYELTFGEGNHDITITTKLLPAKISSIEKPDYVTINGLENWFENLQYKKGDSVIVEVISNKDIYVIDEVTMSNGTVEHIEGDKYKFTFDKAGNHEIKITTECILATVTKIEKPNYISLGAFEEDYLTKEYKKGDVVEVEITSSTDEYVITDVTMSNGSVEHVKGDTYKFTFDEVGDHEITVITSEVPSKVVLGTPDYIEFEGYDANKIYKKGDTFKLKVSSTKPDEKLSGVTMTNGSVKHLTGNEYEFTIVKAGNHEINVTTDHIISTVTMNKPDYVNDEGMGDFLGMCEFEMNEEFEFTIVSDNEDYVIDKVTMSNGTVTINKDNPNSYIFKLTEPGEHEITVTTKIIPTVVTKVTKPDHVYFEWEEMFPSAEFSKGEWIELEVIENDEEYFIENVTMTNGTVTKSDGNYYRFTFDKVGEHEITVVSKLKDAIITNIVKPADVTMEGFEDSYYFWAFDKGETMDITVVSNNKDNYITSVTMSNGTVEHIEGDLYRFTFDKAGDHEITITSEQIPSVVTNVIKPDHIAFEWEDILPTMQFSKGECIGLEVVSTDSEYLIDEVTMTNGSVTKEDGNYYYFTFDEVGDHEITVTTKLAPTTITNIVKPEYVEIDGIENWLANLKLEKGQTIQLHVNSTNSEYLIDEVTMTNGSVKHVKDDLYAFTFDRCGVHEITITTKKA